MLLSSSSASPPLVLFSFSSTLPRRSPPLDPLLCLQAVELVVSSLLCSAFLFSLPLTSALGITTTNDNFSSLFSPPFENQRRRFP
ncbi:hypothetical protein Mapa_011997 [Marchantia paleacea]|nr:hypothetical protein Mapa_011997 [Marchantia paleacea]